MKDTKIQVFCFPHAGGSASVYYKWNRYIDNTVYELIPIEYAGHGTKIDQNLYLQFDEIVDDVYKEILKKLVIMPSILYLGIVWEHISL